MSESPEIFISYNWGVQKFVKRLRQELAKQGYRCWMDINFMGGGDQLFEEIDKGLRGAKVVISCITPKYAASVNCKREVMLASDLGKPLIPCLFEPDMFQNGHWPPKGAMGPLMAGKLFIDMAAWCSGKGDDEFDHLMHQIGGFAQPGDTSGNTGEGESTPAATSPSTGETKQPEDEDSPAGLWIKLCEHIRIPTNYAQKFLADEIEVKDIYQDLEPDDVKDYIDKNVHAKRLVKHIAAVQSGAENPFGQKEPEVVVAAQQVSSGEQTRTRAATSTNYDPLDPMQSSRALFQILDADNSGYIQFEEFVRLTKVCGSRGAKCGKAHKMRKVNQNPVQSHPGYAHGAQCDICRKSINCNGADEFMWHCSSCCYDLCENCGDNQKNMPAPDNTCPGRHYVAKFKIPNNRYGCDKCKQRIAKGSNAFGCRKCNYDFCSNCYTPPRGTCPLYCGLRKFTTPSPNYGCDVCSRRFPSRTTLYGCRKCNWDVCENCYQHPAWQEWVECCSDVGADPQRGLTPTQLTKMYQLTNDTPLDDLSALTRHTNAVRALFKYADKDRDNFLKYQEMRKLSADTANCAGFHGLTYQTGSFICDNASCKKRCREVYGCRTCNWDLCTKCALGVTEEEFSELCEKVNGNPANGLDMIQLQLVYVYLKKDPMDAYATLADKGLAS